MENKPQKITQDLVTSNRLESVILSGMVKSIDPIRSTLTLQKSSEVFHCTKLNRLMHAMPEPTRFAIEYLVSDLADALKMNRTFSPNNNLEISQFIIEEFPTLSLEDIALCFKRIKKGTYGELYGTLNSQTIMKALRQYDAEREAEIERENLALKTESDKANPEQTLAIMQDLIKNALDISVYKDELMKQATPKKEGYEQYRTQFYAKRIIENGNTGTNKDGE